METASNKYPISIPVLSLNNAWKAIPVLIVGIALTIGATYYTKTNTEEIAKRDFEHICNEIKTKIDSRIKAHAQLLRSGAAYLAATDTVTQEAWRIYVNHLKLNRNLPGIQGVGYSLIIPKNQLSKHIQSFKKNGFPEYTVNPIGEREVYTSIIYLEPFSGRNLRAFGYDMFSEPIRKKAMELSRDIDYAILSGKVILKQETEEDVQAGTLMYVTDFKKGMPTNTVEERRAAIKGWVYSPYRMSDLMSGILGTWDLPNINRIRLKIFDNEGISDEALLYDSQAKKVESGEFNPQLKVIIPFNFNGKIWTLQFSGFNESLSGLQGSSLIVLISGIIISFLLFALSLALINTRLRTKQILQLNRQLEKMNLDKDRFISILAHDLKSPFGAILGFADLLSKNVRHYDIDEIETKVNIINDSANRIYNLLDDILIWVKSQSNKMPYEPQKLNLKVVCEEVTEDLLLIANIKNIKINHSFSGELYIYADKNMLNTILRNLISNAIKFTNHGGQISIYAKQNINEVTIVVSDNGVGIKPETMANLFEMSQVNSTTGTAKEKGTGLGLLICKEFVEINGGKIWVESQLGQGSDFKFTLQKFT